MSDLDTANCLLISGDICSYLSVYKSWKPCNANRERKLPYLIATSIKVVVCHHGNASRLLTTNERRRLAGPSGFISKFDGKYAETVAGEPWYFKGNTLIRWGLIHQPSPDKREICFRLQNELTSMQEIPNRKTRLVPTYFGTPRTSNSLLLNTANQY